jgi:hypothetical protein
VGAQAREQQDMEIHASNLCFVGDTPIDVSVCADGSEYVTMRLDEFTHAFNLGIWETVYTRSWDTDTNQFVWAKVSAAAQIGTSDEIIEIETIDGKIIECTPEHLILTKNRGWVEAQHLIETDELIVE